MKVSRSLMLPRVSWRSVESRPAIASVGDCMHPTKVNRATVSCFSVRESKDPKQFQDMEHARHYLTSRASGPSLPGFIQWLSETTRIPAAPYPHRRVASSSLADPETCAFSFPRERGPGSTVGRVYRLVVNNIGQGRVQKGPETQDMSHLFSAADLERLEVLMLLDRSVVARIIRRCPQVLELSHGETAARIILMNSLFRGCDASVLIERAPDSYLLSSEQQLRSMAAMMALLQDQLNGADVISMVHEDPDMLLLDVHNGIEQFKQLWDVDETVLRESDPAELALAVRHLCSAGKARLQQ